MSPECTKVQRAASDEIPFGDIFGEEVVDDSEQFCHTEILGGGYRLLEPSVYAALLGATYSGDTSRGSTSSTRSCSAEPENALLRVRLNPHRAFVWPSSQLMSELLLGCPSLVRGRNVVELGCGLGLPSLAAAKAGAKSVLATDYDENYLKSLRRVAEFNREELLCGSATSSPDARRADCDTASSFSPPSLLLDPDAQISTASGDVTRRQRKIETMNLDWFRAGDQSKGLRERALSVCLCADVNYNPGEETIQALVNAVVATGCELVLLISREKRLGLDQFVSRMEKHFQKVGGGLVVNRAPIFCAKRGIGLCEDERHSLFVFKGNLRKIAV